MKNRTEYQTQNGICCKCGKAYKDCTQINNCDRACVNTVSVPHNSETITKEEGVRVFIDKNILFALIKSHANLNQAEYDRNRTYDSSHPSYQAEKGMISELNRLDLTGEFIQYMGKK